MSPKCYPTTSQAETISIVKAFYDFGSKIDALYLKTQTIYFFGLFWNIPFPYENPDEKKEEKRHLAEAQHGLLFSDTGCLLY